MAIRTLVANKIKYYRAKIKWLNSDLKEARNTLDRVIKERDFLNKVLKRICFVSVDSALMNKDRLIYIQYCVDPLNLKMMKYPEHLWEEMHRQLCERLKRDIYGK